MTSNSQLHPHQVEQELAKLFPGGRWYAYLDGSAVAGVDLAARFSEGSSGRLVMSGLVILGDQIGADQLRAVPVTALENSANLTRKDVREELERLPPLKRTPGMEPEEFSRLVAEHYKVWARRVPHPAAAMAEEHGVKLATLHTWIREARLRGLLPPAKRGKAK
ncbi:hypothetical protein [Microbispora sp. CSR-4]|uniref:hypothetical protein n=1 Tax=Microbispora sp. CSR-4 TaxID=2592813 RepID=UPI0011C846C2|nr:hypothetical protein [Microbispora sp. CSR-4]